jgi:hypothetical protein
VNTLLGHSSMLTMFLPVTSDTERDEILHRIVTELAPLIDVMHL